MTTVAACVPSIPPRADRLAVALASVTAQTRPVDQISVAIDHEHLGAAATRNRAFAAVDCEWTAFLDDDDVWRPLHIEALLRCAENFHADLVFPWFDVQGGTDPFPQKEGVPFDEATLRLSPYIPVTVLVRTDLVRAVGAFPDVPGEDHGLWLRLLYAGAKFVHLPERTWVWNHHSSNTSGLATRW